MGSIEYDFSGWASRNNLRCGDGRVIKPNAFAADNGKTVPLVYQHDHNNLENVIGTATLENRPQGVYMYGKFNDTPHGKLAKTLVQNGNLNRLSIYANHLTQNGPDVTHGMIREVSLVLAGANPGAVVTHPQLEHGETGEVAYCDFEVPILEHSDGSYSEAEDEAIITMPYELQLRHADTEDQEMADQNQGGDNRTVQDVFDSLTDEQKQVVYFLIGKAMEGRGGAVAHDDMDGYDDGDYGDGDYGDEGDYDDDGGFYDEDGNYYVEDENGAGFYDEDGNHYDEADDPNDYGDEGDNMYHNAFEDQGYYMGGDMGGYELTQDDFAEITDNIQRHGGTLKSNLEDFVIAHADDYGIKDIETLFPDATDLTNSPEFIKRETDWVGKFMNGTKHSPFSRIRTRFADITADEARAKGYTKGHKKIEEVFTLLKRTTEPCTIYKKQKIDRDDVIDITSFDVVAYIKGEMRIMYDEELARAALVGDGRDASSDDKIPEDHIRPIATDDVLFTITVDVEGSTVEDVAKTFVDDHVIAMDDYKGSGNVTMFIRQDLFTRLMLLKDGQGYRLYKSPSELASALMVDGIQTVPNDIMSDYYSISVDLSDYTFGADKGGQMSFFEDFDIDYNQQKYLYEGRQSGCLTKPKSAIVMKKKAATSPAG